MVLSDRTIKEELAKGRIVIYPLDPEDIHISNPGEKLTKQSSLQDGETIVEVINAIQPNP